MKTLADFLKWYNNKDVVPFLEAIETQSRLRSLNLKKMNKKKKKTSLPSILVLFEYRYKSQTFPKMNTPIARQLVAAEQHF